MWDKKAELFIRDKGKKSQVRKKWDERSKIKEK